MEKQRVFPTARHGPSTLTLLCCRLVLLQCSHLLSEAYGKECKLSATMAGHATKSSGR